MDCERTLGAYISLSLKQIKQFEIMKEKMLEAVSKLRNITIAAPIAYIFLNIYLIKNAFWLWSDNY